MPTTHETKQEENVNTHTSTRKAPCVILDSPTRQQRRVKCLQRADPLGFGDHQHHHLFCDAAVQNQCRTSNGRGKDGHGGAVRLEKAPLILQLL